MEQTKIVSQLDADGYFVGSAVADMSPLEPGVWLVPGGAVDAPPPDIPEGMWAKWAGSGWEMVDASAPSDPAPITTFATREYLERFTDDEYAAARYSTNFRVQRTLDSMIAAGFIDVADPAVAAGLDLMVAEGVIAAARKSELLAPETPAAFSA